MNELYTLQSPYYMDHIHSHIILFGPNVCAWAYFWRNIKFKKSYLETKL